MHSQWECLCGSPAPALTTGHFQSQLTTGQKTSQTECIGVKRNDFTLPTSPLLPGGKLSAKRDLLSLRLLPQVKVRACELLASPLLSRLTLKAEVCCVTGLGQGRGWEFSSQAEVPSEVIRGTHCLQITSGSTPMSLWGPTPSQTSCWYMGTHNTSRISPTYSLTRGGFPGCTPVGTKC